MSLPVSSQPQPIACVVVQVDAGKSIRLVMERLLQLTGTEQLRDRRFGERSIGRESHGERIDHLAQWDHTGERVFGPVNLLGENDIRGPVPGKIFGVDPEPALLRRRVRVIQPEIAGYQVGTTVLVEVSNREAVPPAAQRW